jgi:hypothetical protein
MPKSEVELCEKLGTKIVYGVGGGKVQSSSWLVKNFEKAKQPQERFANFSATRK